MELADLRSFIDVAEALNIRRAAMAAGVKPSTISRRIARIEGELGVSVFERHSSGVRLTRAGRDFLQTPPTVLHALELAARRARPPPRRPPGRPPPRTFPPTPARSAPPPPPPRPARPP